MILFVTFSILIFLFITGWIVANKIKNASIVDAMWALSLSIPVLIYITFHNSTHTRKIILLTMALLWSLRLGIHLVKRIHIKHPSEDKRYAALRQKWGTHANRNFLIIFLINATLVFLLSLPFYFSSQFTAPLQSLEWIGITIFITGVIGEAIADHQLNTFKAKPNDEKICTIGLWNYSRHPNYFFEALIWFGIYIFCATSPSGIYTIHAPILITFLLLKVTGIPTLEHHLLKSRGLAYKHYQQTTNAFIPWFKKKTL